MPNLTVKESVMLLTFMSAPDVSFDEVLLTVLAFNIVFLTILTFTPKWHNTLTKWFL